VKQSEYGERNYKKRPSERNAFIQIFFVLKDEQELVSARCCGNTLANIMEPSIKTTEFQWNPHIQYIYKVIKRAIQYKQKIPDLQSMKIRDKS
jgi:hypothetical protein